MATQLRRDSFSRASLMRECVPQYDRQSCAWCGNPAKYRYYWEADGESGGRVRNPRRLFDSVQCAEAYGEI